ncbi:MAG: hypothetical protein ACREBD_28350 [Blastocatellia bacterium]
MEETIKLELTKSEAQQLSEMLEEVLDALQKAIERMAKEQEEIDQLRAETREVLQRDWRGGVDVEAILRPV